MTDSEILDITVKMLKKARFCFLNKRCTSKASIQVRAVGEAGILLAPTSVQQKSWSLRSQQHLLCTSYLHEYNVLSCKLAYGDTKSSRPYCIFSLLLPNQPYSIMLSLPQTFKDFFLYYHRAERTLWKSSSLTLLPRAGLGFWNGVGEGAGGDEDGVAHQHI